MEIDVFAGIAVTDLARSREWYDALLGDVETFVPNDTEQVWTLGVGRHVYVEVDPERAGRSVCTLFVEDLDGFLIAATERGLRPESEETYDNGVRKTIFRDPDGNEVGVGGGPAQ